MKKLWLTLAFLCMASAAHGQAFMARVVPSCNVSNLYSQNSTNAATMDVNGNFCTAGGSAASTVTAQPQSFASGKVVVNNVALTANTNTTLSAANANRLSWAVQCGTGGVVVSETGATLASGTFGAAGQSIYIPTGTQPYFSPPGATQTAITAYTGTAQSCVEVDYTK